MDIEKRLARLEAAAAPADTGLSWDEAIQKMRETFSKEEFAEFEAALAIYEHTLFTDEGWPIQELSDEQRWALRVVNEAFLRLNL